MLLDPGARAAVENVAVPLLSLAVSRMLPLLTSVNLTEPVGVPVAALTLAVNFTHESRVIDAADDASVIFVAISACGDAGAAIAAAGAMRPAAAAMPEPNKKRPAQRTVAHLLDC